MVDIRGWYAYARQSLRLRRGRTRRSVGGARRSNAGTNRHTVYELRAGVRCPEARRRQFHPPHERCGVWVWHRRLHGTRRTGGDLRLTVTDRYALRRSMKAGGASAPRSARRVPSASEHATGSRRCVRQGNVGHVTTARTTMGADGGRALSNRLRPGAVVERCREACPRSPRIPPRQRPCVMTRVK